MSIKDNRKKKAGFVFLVIIWVAIIMALALGAVLSNAGTGGLGAPETSSTEILAAPEAKQTIATVDLTGRWTTKINETTFLVDVANNTVTIKMSKNNSTMVYWYGTFINNGAIGESITSTKLDINKAVLSGADSKVFSVKDNALVFDVSAMGQTRKVEVVHA